MSEPPQLRLVPRTQYALLFSKWLLHFNIAIVCSILGGGLLVIELFYLSLQLAIFCHVPIDVEQTVFDGPLALLILPCAGLLAMAGLKLFKRIGTEIPFTPITPENTHLLPAAESLVRPSTPPPQSQTTELLRAVSASAETPQDQLLRAPQISPKSNLV